MAMKKSGPSYGDPRHQAPLKASVKKTSTSKSKPPMKMSGKSGKKGC